MPLHSVWLDVSGTKVSELIHLIACVSVPSVQSEGQMVLPWCVSTVMCHSPADRWTVDALLHHFLVSVDSVAIAHVPGSLSFISLGSYLEVGLLDLMPVLFQTRHAYPILLSPTEHKVPIPPHPFQHCLGF